MKHLIIILQGMSYEDRTQHLVDALKNENNIDIKDQMTDQEYKTLQQVLNNEKISGQFKFALIDTMFEMIKKDHPEKNAITNMKNPRIPMIAEKYHGYTPVRVFLNDADVDGGMVDKILEAYPFKIENYVLLYGDDYEKMAKELLSKIAAK